MKKNVPCLVRTGHDVKRHTVLRLKKDQITIGRSRQATYTLPSRAISRWHAVISHLPGTTWTLLDANSLNGIRVNGHPLKPFVPYKLHEGNVIQFAACNSRRAEYQYRFYKSYHTTAGNNRQHVLLMRMFSEALVKEARDKLEAIQGHGDISSTILKCTETQLQCDVCRNLPVQATVLNCSHMFCKQCTIKWMESSDRCPMCQQFIVSVLHDVALDARLNNKIAEQLSEREDQRREIVVHLKNGKKNRSRDTIIDHLAGLRIERTERFAVSTSRIRPATRVSDLNLAAVSTERITRTTSVVSAQTSFIKEAKQQLRRTAFLRRPLTKHQLLAARIRDRVSRTAVCRETAFEKLTALKGTAAFRTEVNAARTVENATRATTDELGTVTTADACIVGKAEAIPPVDGSIVTHCCKDIRNSSKPAYSDSEVG